MNATFSLSFFSSQSAMAPMNLRPSYSAPSPSDCRCGQESHPLSHFSILNQATQGQGIAQSLSAVWAAILQPPPSAPPLPGHLEMSKGQQQAVGPHQVKVDEKGGMTVSTQSPSLQVAGAMSQSGPGGTSMSAFAASFQGESKPPVRIENGMIHLPNGQSRPFGRTGLIVETADGRQFAVGRNSADSKEHIRWVTAEKGQEIPVSPPGATTVLRLDEQGNVVSENVR